MAKGGRIELRPVWPFDDGPAEGDPVVDEVAFAQGRPTFFQFVVDTPDGEPWDASADSEFEEWHAENLRDRYVIAGGRLRPIEDATLIRRRGGELLVSDGPFAESRELVGGFDVLACDSFEQTIGYASHHPMTRMGAIELRPLWPMDGDESPTGTE
ncbi:hypothetical protein FLP23_11195 [Protaetiibacter larvae]|uniref:YCII-related domain-containing protein n=2 Tax=Protaetiibacter larvae TaxID=2592654 RepID=A0A5C1YC86_9MICO|nr:hypothetical protein FLP23_11195 [Protaetiibacter larvae]